jgi:YfiH family protein
MSRSLFTSRFGGLSKGEFESFNLALHVGDDAEIVESNRELLARELGIKRSELFFMNQVHSSTVVEIDEGASYLDEPAADALFTRRSGIALAVLTADCIPLLLSSPSAIAAVHIGRKGLVAGVLEATLEKFESYGIAFTQLSALLGASICGDCYQVSLEIYRQVVGQIAQCATDESKRCLDLEAGVISILRERGITVSSIGECSKHSPGYFSFRRDSRTGRQAGVIIR